MGKDCKYGGEPSLLLAAAVAAQLAQGKNAREIFELGKFINLIKENLYLLADRRLNWHIHDEKEEKFLQKKAVTAAKQDKDET